MNESFTIIGRNFYDSVSKTTIVDVNLADYGVYLGQQSSGLWKDILIPANENYIDKVHGQNGAYYFGSVYSERKLSLPCYVENICENTLRDIQEILSIHIPMKLIIDEHPYRYIEVVSDGQIDFDSIRINGYSGVFVVNFIAYAPFWKSFYTSLDYELHSEYIYDYRSIFDNLSILPRDVPSCIFANLVTNSYFPLFNHGNTDAKLLIGLTGTGTNIIVTNSSSNESFVISSMNNENILIDGERALISNASITTGIVGTETALKSSLFTGKFITLKPKLNNFSIVGDSLNLSVQFLYRHTYL